MDKPFLRVLAGETVRPAPFWLMRQAGRYLPEYRRLRASAENFLALCLSPALASEATLQPVRRFGTDAAILFSDILTVPHAMGQAVRFEEGTGPVLGEFDETALRPVGGALDPVYETVRLAQNALPDETALIGFAGAPWTVAAYMIEGGSSRDWVRVRRMAVAEPGRFSDLIDRLTEATASHLIAQADAGAEALQLFDSWAGVLTSSQFRQLCIEPTRRVTEELQASHPSLPIIGFPKGASMPDLLAYARDSGVTAVGVDHSVDPREAARQLQPLVPVQGNLDPDMLTPGRPGLPEAVRQVRQAFANGPHVFNLGHGIRPNADPERVSELVARVRGEE